MSKIIQAFDLVDDILYRFGVVVTLAFLVWIEVAPLDNPSWWDSSMQYSMQVAVFLAMVSVLMTIAVRVPSVDDTKSGGSE